MCGGGGGGGGYVYKAKLGLHKISMWIWYNTKMSNCLVHPEVRSHRSRTVISQSFTKHFSLRLHLTFLVACRPFVSDNYNDRHELALLAAVNLLLF